MRKGLGVALWAAAWASFQVSAFAIAPTIADLPDVIIGDLEGATDPATGTNNFVFPDAIDLRTVIQNEGDLTTSADNLIWSFWSMDQKYWINGFGPLSNAELTLGLGPALPPTNKRLNEGSDGNTGADSPEDSEPYTITYRNGDLSPIGGPNVDPGTGPGIIDTETRVVTLFASTGTTFGEKSQMVYTANVTSDSLSGGVDDTFLQSFDFTQASTVADWLSGVTLGSGSVSQGPNGICMTVPGPGDNIVLWVSGENDIPLMDQVVYRARLNVNTDQSGTDAIPLFNFNYDNFQTGAGFLNYGGEHWIWDGSGAGGSQGIGRPNGRDVFEVFFAPPVLNFDTWRSSNPNGSTAFDAAADDINDIRITFRILDLGGGADALSATADLGTICIESATISTVLIGTIDAKKESIYNVGLHDGIAGAGSDPNSAARTYFEQSDENLVSYPNVQADIVSGAWQVSLGTIPTGTGIVRATLGPDVVATGSILLPGNQLRPERFYPILWETDTIYMTEADVRTGTGSGTDAADVMIFNFEAYGAELGGTHFITPQGADLSSVPGRTGPDGGGMLHAGAPPTGTAETAVWFFSGNNEPANPNAIANANGWKAQIDLFNREDLNGGGTSGQDQFIAERVENFRLNLSLSGN